MSSTIKHLKFGIMDYAELYSAAHSVSIAILFQFLMILDMHGSVLNGRAQ